MEKYENNAFFWQKIDTLYSSATLEIYHKKGECHPEFADMIYPVDYGRLKEVNGERGVCVYKGSQKHAAVKAVIIAVDILKRELDVKILIGCNEEEEEALLRFLNQTDFQKTILVRRGNELPAWGFTD
ncbi:MAG: Inorganic pyrophosphatase [Erysipelotrichaceae bacterium]|nr:Inorganic pyrophosphatase [Erysipelotrichaceae bacterium]MDY5252047.1 Inorganic pyrophosphatase [Erysipelotrichaceae bacterium]